MMARSVRMLKETLEIRSWIFKRLQAHRYFSYSVVAGVILLACCVHVWQRVVVVSLVQEVSVLQTENKKLVDRAKKLDSEITALSISTRIERYAVDTLGLRPVSGDRLFTLMPGESHEVSADRLTLVLSSIRRVAEYLPVITETQATARELEAIIFQDDVDGGK